jgi:hypothetical protein
MNVMFESVWPELDASAAVTAEAEIAVPVIPVDAVVETVSVGDHLLDWTTICAIAPPHVETFWLFCASPLYVAYQ